MKKDQIGVILLKGSKILLCKSGLHHSVLSWHIPKIKVRGKDPEAEARERVVQDTNHPAPKVLTDLGSIKLKRYSIQLFAGIVDGELASIETPYAPKTEKIMNFAHRRHEVNRIERIDFVEISEAHKFMAETHLPVLEKAKSLIKP